MAITLGARGLFFSKVRDWRLQVSKAKALRFLYFFLFQVKLWSLQLWAQFLQLRREAWKIQDFNGVWTRDLAIPVRRSNQLSYEATDVGHFLFGGITVVEGHSFWRLLLEHLYFWIFCFLSQQSTSFRATKGHASRIGHEDCCIQCANIWS